MRLCATSWACDASGHVQPACVRRCQQAAPLTSCFAATRTQSWPGETRCACELAVTDPRLCTSCALLKRARVCRREKNLDNVLQSTTVYANVSKVSCGAACFLLAAPPQPCPSDRGRAFLLTRTTCKRHLGRVTRSVYASWRVQTRFETFHLCDESVPTSDTGAGRLAGERKGAQGRV